MWRVLAVAVLLAACAPAPQVSVSLYQTRSDTPLDKIEIQVRNDGDDAITVQRAELRSTRLVDSVAWEEPVAIPPGAAMDLKVDLPAADCAGSAGETVEVQIDGRTMVLDAADTLGQLASYVTQACFSEDVEATADIEVGDVTAEGLQVRVDPGAAEIGRLGTTILFVPADRGAIAAGAGSAPRVRQVVLRPNRCDAHALGEDKQGTYFDVEVTLPDGRAGRYTFGVNPEQRGQLYQLYATMCGLS